MEQTARLHDNAEDWHEGFVVDSSDVTVDATGDNELLPKLEGRPDMARLQLAHPTLSLTDANVVYVMGKVDEKATALTVDMANKRLQRMSVCDAEIIIDGFDYAYTQSTVSQYLTTAAGVKGNLKRPWKFHMQYLHKRQGEIISWTDITVLYEQLQLDAGSYEEIKDETEGRDMDLEQSCIWSETKWP